MKLLALDIGDKRVGVAFGDTQIRLATPVQVLTRGPFEQDSKRLAAIVRNYAAERLIAGLPRNMDGTLGPQADAAKAYAEKIAAAVGIPLEFWDEQLTTVEASRRTAVQEPLPRRSGRRKGRKPRPPLDAVAAAIILQDYMDSHVNKGGHDVA